MQPLEEMTDSPHLEDYILPEIESQKKHVCSFLNNLKLGLLIIFIINK